MAITDSGIIYDHFLVISASNYVRASQYETKLDDLFDQIRFALAVYQEDSR